ncbi:DUF3618 domain-containing protein [Oerskovia sp. NPDC056781]|uniref:DUF3618 domain-containing protein n=1 Tax=Oerskovia sp. NPDC056781 TaxID=3345942 RepID=UPI00367043C2
MSTDPEQLRNEIEQTRTDLSNDVDALGDKVNPTHIARRQTDRVRHSFTSVKDKVMGTSDTAVRATTGAASSAADSARGAVGSASDGVSSAASSVRDRAEGNPLAVGLVAFGVGLVVASLLPSSQTEQRAASRVQDAAAPLVDDVKEAASSLAENMKEPAQDSAHAVQDAAKDAAEGLVEEGKAAASDVRSTARDS